MSPRNYVKRHYGKKTHKEIINHLDITLGAYRGIVASLVADDLVVSLNKAKKKTKKAKKNETTFNNVEGVGKVSARMKMIKHLRKLGGLVLTLPSHTCRIEEMLVEDSANVYKFVGCEADRNVYKQMVDKAMSLDLDMDFHNCMLGDIVKKANKDEFAHVIMDYCGTLHKAQDDIRIALTNDIVQVGGTISITLNSRSAEVGGIVDTMHNINSTLPNGITKTTNALLTFTKVFGGLRYKIETVFKYKDTASMVLVIVKRLK